MPLLLVSALLDEPLSSEEAADSMGAVELEDISLELLLSVAALPLSEEAAEEEDSVVAELLAGALDSSFLAQALARAMTPAMKTTRATGLNLATSNMFTLLLARWMNNTMATKQRSLTYL
ncbi:hypothetical protein BAE29_14145 [Acidithiobacillus caldus]|uniref:Uncharacterized protein n=1 Tax=Acidithiobacillus caldus TaxID=33059 RepID=A0A1E7YJS1_9PROT|nr:hypothetical protein BAE27_13675 [Acidithiobacillus caldus]OFC30291.1 hypothetical protein BAE28_14610 [Acidithiobacillus caldus]OFC35924.1 hypothetical protein BAE29_14145 [Acidithiobacillus caldus]